MRDARGFRLNPGAAVGIASVLLWLTLLLAFRPNLIADERFHYPAIEAIAAGDHAPAAALPMFPFFHYVAAGVTWIASGPRLWLVRALSAACTCAAIVLYGASARREERSQRALLLAWQPLLLPYAALAYTEPMSTMFVCAALLGRRLAHDGAAALSLVFAILTRQSNALLGVWLIATTPSGRTRGRYARNLNPYAFVSVFVLATIVFAPRYFVRPSEANSPRFNIAQFYFFALAWIALNAPLWTIAARRCARDWFKKRGWGWRVALAVAAVGLLEMSYRNPHPWNANPDYLHDRVLAALMTSAVARWLVAGLLVAVAACWLSDAARRGGGWPLTWTWVFSLVYLGFHGLVDPRYAILPLVLLDDATPMSPAERAALVAWRGVLSVMTCSYLLSYGGPHSGL